MEYTLIKKIILNRDHIDGFKAKVMDASMEIEKATKERTKTKTKGKLKGK